MRRFVLQPVHCILTQAHKHAYEMLDCMAGTPDALKQTAWLSSFKA
jgi:hypothetical protein